MKFLKSSLFKLFSKEHIVPMVFLLTLNLILLPILFIHSDDDDGIQKENNQVLVKKFDRWSNKIDNISLEKTSSVTIYKPTQEDEGDEVPENSLSDLVVE